VRGTWRRAVRIARNRHESRPRWKSDRAFDSAQGVDTATWVRTPDLVTDSPNREFAVRYQPSNTEDFLELLAMIDVDHREFVFVDYGSGKGKALMLAAAYPFKRIVGVEFSEPLASVARTNVAALGDGAERIETVVMDATRFEPPPEPLVAYFFNPFGLPVLKPVLARLRESLEQHPRPLVVLATGPPELAEAIEEAGFAPRVVERLGWLTRGAFTPEGIGLETPSSPEERGEGDDRGGDEEEHRGEHGKPSRGLRADRLKVPHRL
jgi:hypothetical protein